MKKLKTLSLIVTIIVTISSCKKNPKYGKDHECYDAALEQQYDSMACTADVPGYVGCDGFGYSNECQANRAGIK